MARQMMMVNLVALQDFRRIAVPVVHAAAEAVAPLLAAGATAWVFTGLSTARPEDFVFTLLNTVIPPARVQIDLYFAEKAKAVRYIQTEIGGSCFKEINIVGEEVDGDAKSFNAASLKVKGIPENEPFAVRFTSDTPIIVSHRDHAPVYHSAF